MSGTDQVLLWVEQTAFSTWMRESPSMLAFPTILSCHTVGMGLVAGINVIFGLRILGVAPLVSTGELKRFVPLMWFGFWLNAISGVALLLAYPTKAFTNPMFYLKLGLIALAMVAFVAISRSLFPKTPLAREATSGSKRVRLLAQVSIGAWAGAIIAGRLLAYTYTRLLADF